MRRHMNMRSSTSGSAGRLGFLTVLIVIALFASACSGGADEEVTDDDPVDQDGDDGEGRTDDDERTSDEQAGSSVTTVRLEGSDTAGGDTEIIIELGEADGARGPGTVDRETTVDGVALDPADTALLLGRLPDLAADEADQVEFLRPPETRPRPRPGTTLDQAFPPPAPPPQPEVDDPGPLEVLRYQPEGPVDLAPFISITFNQPMVALGTLDQIEGADVPITITPEMPGRWLWLGTRTVRFEYEPGAIDRIPAATNFVVEVPADTTSLTGGDLDEALRFEFSTPTPQVRRVSPMNEALSTTPIFFIEFDQRVDPGAVLEVTTLAMNGSAVALRLATDDEIAENDTISGLAERALPERWIAVRPVDDLDTDATLQLRIGPGTPSAEGPETNPDASVHEGRTHGPLELLETRCGYDDRCRPGQQFRLQFSNPLDAELFRADQVTIEPAIPGARIGVSWNEITIQGRTVGQTTYEIAVDESLTDVYGQELGTDARGTVRVGDADPALFPPGRQLITLDPIIADDRLNVTSTNNDVLAVRIYEVDPREDWIPYLENGWRLAEDDWNPRWRVLDERIIDTDTERNAFGETAIELGDQLDATGHVVVVVAPPGRGDDEWQNRPFAVWVQRTTLGLDAVTDNQLAVARVTDLRTGEAIDGVRVELLGGDAGTTDADGVALLELGGNTRGLLAESEDQIALLGDFWADRWARDDELRWYVIDDRGLYKPGETVSMKGFVRRADAQTPSDLSLPRQGASVTWRAQDGFGNEIGTGEAPLSPLGGFDLELELPDDITLGFAGIQFSTDGFRNVNNASWWHEIQVQEFRRPDFEVSTEVVSAEPHFVGDTLTLDATAEYFAGGPLAGSPVDWQVSGNTTSYAPPNWPDFTFGIWVPWWQPFEFSIAGDVGFGSGIGLGFDPGQVEFYSSTTDEAGRHDLALTVRTQGKPQPVTVSASATVIDVNRQPISGSTSALIHPADLYVGLRGPRTFVEAGEPFTIDVIVTDLDGTLVAGRDVEVATTRLEWRFEGGSWVEIPVPDESCGVTSADGPVGCEFTPSVGGRYRISATVTDDDGRDNLTELTRWVSGGTRPQSRRVALEQLTLIPDGESWQPGDTAEVLVQSPFSDAHGLAVISRSGIDRTQTFDFDETGSAVLTIPVTEGDIGGIGVQLEVVGTAPRSLDGSDGNDVPPRPAYAAGQITLPVPPDSRALNIDVAPRSARLEPGTDTQVDVAVTTPDGQPVEGAELAVVVVDEAVLSLTGYRLDDPLDAFYPGNSGFAQSWRGRATLVLSDPDLGAGGDGADLASDDAVEEAAEFEEAGAAPMPTTAESRAGLGAAQGQQSEIELRTNFEALAVFAPEVTTDADGRATIDVPLPDNLTRYRVMVVATADATDAGSGESNITARLPVTVRPTPPRFANFGDRFEFPVVVQNATDDDLEVDVALRATNLNVDGRAGTTVTVPANDRIEVRFEVSADEAGTARYQVAAASGQFADAAEGSFPVYTPATAEAFATYGVVDDGSISQPFTEPSDVFPQFGGLEITTSSTAVSALTDAVIYLEGYRYDSSDAFASRIIAIVALDEVLEAFDAEQLPPPDELRSVINDDVDRLAAMQNDDGGFPYWRRGRDSIPYHSVQATHALVLARNEGVVVGERTLTDALWYLANIEDHIPSWYGERTKRAIGAYALHVRWLAGDRDTAKATRILDDADGEQLDVAAWLWPVLADTPQDDEIERLFQNRVTETPNAATFATNYEEEAWVLLHSDRRTDAIVLDSFLRMRPESDLVLKTLNGLLAARDRRGHWTNVQENSFVLLAGAAYFEQFEDVDPDFIARAWLGDTYAVEHAYQGRTTDFNATLVPMSVVVGDGEGRTGVGDGDIIVLKDGDDGRLYYRLGLRYAPTDFELEPRDQGFVVARRYEAVDDPDDVVRNDDGSWTVRAGARVRIRLTMVADSRRTHVALIDPMPAGFEAINPALATSEPIPQADPSETAVRGFWWYRWFDHQNLRDDRAEAFSTYLGAGSYEYTYVARATTPGTFVVPPTRAEQIYEPEVFGRSANTTVEVVD